MFTRGFATQVIAPAGQGQPGFVADPVHWVSTVIAAHPVAWNVPFVAAQLLIAVGLLVARTARPALAASIAWALGLWYLGEGLAGLASGDASLLTGAPGSALLYAILAAAAWPQRDGSREPASWLPYAWATVWVGGALLQALPSQNTGEAVASALTGGTGGAPAWLAGLDTSAGSWAAHHGPLLVTLLAVAEALIGVGALARTTRTLAVALGLALTLAFWVLGQDLGALWTGQATDPNSGPLLALMAIALLVRPRRDGLSISPFPVRDRGERRDVPAPRPGSNTMAQYLLSVHTVEGEAGAPMTEAEMKPFMERVNALQDEMRASGSWVFGGRLYASDTATVVRASGAEVLTTDGPFAESKEHLGGFYIVEAENLDDALAWAAKTSAAVGKPIEVRPFWEMPGD
jgi:hypothetical protein